MRRKFKNYEDAENYFKAFEIDNLKTPSEFSVIYQLSQEMLNCKELAAKKKSFWKKLKASALKRADDLGWRVVCDDNIAELCSQLAEMLNSEQVAELICKISDFSEFSDEELNLFLDYCNNCESGPKMEEMTDLLYSERAKRNPNLN